MFGGGDGRTEQFVQRWGCDLDNMGLFTSYSRHGVPRRGPSGPSASPLGRTARGSRHWTPPTRPRRRPRMTAPARRDGNGAVHTDPGPGPFAGAERRIGDAYSAYPRDGWGGPGQRRPALHPPPRPCRPRVGRRRGAGFPPLRRVPGWRRGRGHHRPRPLRRAPAGPVWEPFRRSRGRNTWLLGLPREPVRRTLGKVRRPCPWGRGGSGKRWRFSSPCPRGNGPAGSRSHAYPRCRP